MSFIGLHFSLLLCITSLVHCYASDCSTSQQKFESTRKAPSTKVTKVGGRGTKKSGVKWNKVFSKSNKSPAKPSTGQHDAASIHLTTTSTPRNNSTLQTFTSSPTAPGQVNTESNNTEHTIVSSEINLGPTFATALTTASGDDCDPNSRSQSTTTSTTLPSEVLSVPSDTTSTKVHTKSKDTDHVDMTVGMYTPSNVDASGAVPPTTTPNHDKVESDRQGTSMQCHDTLEAALSRVGTSVPKENKAFKAQNLIRFYEVMQVLRMNLNEIRVLEPSRLEQIPVWKLSVLERQALIAAVTAAAKYWRRQPSNTLYAKKLEWYEWLCSGVIQDMEILDKHQQLDHQCCVHAQCPAVIEDKMDVIYGTRRS